MHGTHRTPRHAPRHAVLATAFLAGAVALSGCASAPPARTDATVAPQVAPAAAPDLGSPPSTAAPMPYEAKRAALPPDYPLQVPVIAGEVVRAGARDSSVWVYELRSPHDARATASWYRVRYEAAAWSVAGLASEVRDGRETYVLTLRKGDAVSEVSVSADAAGSLVRTSIGIGQAPGGSS